MPPSDSFADVMQRLREPDPQAAAVVFRRFAARLAVLARACLGERLQSKVDADDVLQSAYRTFLRRHAAGELELDGWDALWALLTVITIRKCGRWREHFHAGSRDVRREVPTDGAAAGAALPDGREPSPDEAGALADFVESLLRRLSPRDREIVSLRLQGYSPLETATELRLPQRTVFRVLQRVKQQLHRQTRP
jgi:RNA polymerase sigma-70 factor (ECF subfamily)